MTPSTLLADDLLATARRLGASDVHLCAGELIRFRIDGRIVPIDNELVTAEEISDIAAALLTPRARRLLARHKHVDSALHNNRYGRFRIHAYRAEQGLHIAIRRFIDDVPDARAIGLPAALLEDLPKRRGLVLFAGATGSGKTTSLAAALQFLNERCERHIVTIEDPIEYRLRSQRALITQREVGRDVVSFHAGIVSALRSDPDILAIGELRDSDAMVAALRAAETGHLVLATVHGQDTQGAVERIIDALEHRHPAVRGQLAAVLEAVLAVDLRPRVGGGRLLVSELLLGTQAVRALIREARTHHIGNAIATGRAQGMYLFATCAAERAAAGELAA